MEAKIGDDGDDWDKPFTSEELEAIDAAFEEAAAESESDPTAIRHSLSLPLPPCSSSKTPRPIDYDDPHPPKTRRRLPGSIMCSKSNACPQRSPLALLAPADMKMKYPTMNFGGRIVYCRTVEEVEEATLQIFKLLDVKKRELGRAVLGVDIEWKPSFRQGIPQRKAAVLQICGDMRHCYVLHIIHSGVPHSLRSLLEDPTSIKVGVGIVNDGVKMFHDHDVSIKSLEDLSTLANKKLGGVSKQWSLSSLVETLTCKQLLKPKKIRLGNWEASFLSKQQLKYAATDAFASWYVYEVLHSFPVLSESQKEE